MATKSAPKTTQNPARKPQVRQAITLELVQAHAPHAGLAENLSRTQGGPSGWRMEGENIERIDIDRNGRPRRPGRHTKAGWFVSGVVIHLFTRWTLRGLKA